MKIRTAYQRKAQAATSRGSIAVSRGLRRWHQAAGSVLPTGDGFVAMNGRSLAIPVGYGPLGCLLGSEATVGRDETRRRSRMR